MSAPHPRRRLLLAGAAVLVVAAAATLVLVLTLGDGDDEAAPPDSPRAAAQQWIDAHVHHDAKRFEALSCDGADSAAGIFDMTIGAAVASVSAGPAQPHGADEWQVPLAVQGPTGPLGDYDVTVRREHGAYLVC